MSSLTRILETHRKQAFFKTKGELHAKDGSWVLKWDREWVKIVEAPINSPKDPMRALDPGRGKKAVEYYWNARFPEIRYPIIPNVVEPSGMKVSDSAAQIRAKIEASYRRFLDFLRAKPVEELTWNNPKQIPYVQSWLEGKDRSYPTEVVWYKTYLAPAEFVPKSMKPLKIKGMDFELTVNPDKFRIYSRYEAYGSGDDSYSGYESKSPAAARKLYLIVAKNPKALEHVNMNRFTKFLSDHKIAYDTISSSWR